MAEQIRYKTIVEQVMEKIKELIADGEYRPTQKLASEAELAERFGVGRSSIREAIKVFQYLGILRVSKAKGTFVCESSNISVEALTWAIILGNKDLDNLLDLRMLLEEKGIETLIERRAKGRRSVDGLLKKMEAEVAGMKKAISKGRIEDLIDADYAFHELIIQGADNPVYVAIYLTLRSFLHGVIKEVFFNRLGVTTAVKTHSAIIDSIRGGTREATLKLYRKHIAVTRERIRSNMAASARTSTRT